VTEKKEILADCTICEYYQEYDGIQGCNKFDLIGLPDIFRVGTSKKCCSSFSTNRLKYKIPDISKMDEGVLYFYSPDNLNELKEDIDL
jgi:hypothetical protein